MLSRLVRSCAVLLVAAPCAAAELKLYPSDIPLTGPRAAQQLLLIEEDAGSAIADRTPAAKFSTANPNVAIVDESGLVRPVGDGETAITATANGKTAQTKVRVTKAKDPAPPTFRNDVLPILTRAGCNSGACHGALAGKGGMKLSLRGYDPDADHFVLTRQALSRRVDRTDPAKSLMLLKSTRTMTHGGGTRIEVGSWQYHTVLEWIGGGAAGVSPSDPRVERIEVLPKHAVLKPKDTLRVLVLARYTDGRVLDVSRLAKFVSSEAQIADVDEDGTIKVGGNGEAAVSAIFNNRVATATITSPFPNAVEERAFASSPKANFIDEHVVRKLRELHLSPSPQCSDAQFIRRAYLDAAGILPTTEELTKFLADTSPDKRTRLIDAILERPEFVDYWAYKWCDVMLVSTRKLPQPAMWAFYRSVRQAVADNNPWDRFARDLLLSTGSSLQHGAGNFFVLHKDVADLTESVSLTFLGTSITCARCHNHPLEKWTQDQYWSMANLFSRVGMKNGDRAGEIILQASTEGNVLHPRKAVPMPPTPLDGKPLSLDDTGDRRAHFANWLTSPDNPYFAKAVVNRVWKNFLGRGLVEAEDDIRETNPPSNPELLNDLAKDLIEHKYDVKYLVRLVMNSAAYQRSSRPVKGNETDERFYSKYIVRRLSGEVILDALSQVTGVPTPFTQVYTGVEGGTAATNNYPEGTRALQLPDSQVASRFLEAFGRPDRVQTCSCERQQDSTVGQALMLNNGQSLNDKLRSPKGRLNAWLTEKVTDEEAVKRVFALALSREPTSSELKKMTVLLHDASSPPEAHREALEDVFWAVLTSREFLFNH
ncbi:MAG TPA: DUF1549 and DUF1553 domain-containing protein [Gemmataceae bacterium]|nr:DUF1549 and DUF1553 domain-containing protein [Gemmataceae bacterium]